MSRHMFSPILPTMKVDPRPRDAAMPDFSKERIRMVETQIAGRGIRDPLLLEAIGSTPREKFVSPGFERLAYEDGPLPIGQGQTISQPYIVALMIEAAGIRPGARVLEVGAGSGYAAAVMSRIAGQVYAIERHPSLAKEAEQRFQQLGYNNITLRVGDGSRGWPEAGPFDAVLVSAAAPVVPADLKQQLVVGGRLLIPVGAAHGSQRLHGITRTGPTEFEDENLGGVAFVPLISEQGWKEGAQQPAPRE